MSQTWECSRRTFLQAGTVAALSAGTLGSLGTATASPSEPSVSSPSTRRFDELGSPSREADRAWARAEYDHSQRVRGGNAQQGSPSGGNSSSGAGSPTSPKFSQTKNAVKDYGADPKGNRPISEDIPSTIPDGTVIVFPPGEYLISGTWQVEAEGSGGLAGKGYKQASKPPKPGKQAATFVAESGSRSRISFSAKTGLFANVVLDQSRSNCSIGLVVESSGFNQARDVRYNGIQDNTNSSADESQEVPLCALQATSTDATARAERVVGQYVGQPGTKESGGAPFFWVGQSNEGTAQMGNCVVMGAADNALYGSRTPGKAQVKGGTFHNNAVSQLRISGKGSWVDGATISIDAENYKGPTPKQAYNEKYGVNGVKVERGDKAGSKPSGVVIKNTDIRVKSTGSNGMGAPVLVRGSGGALKIENCRIVNQVGGASVRAESPGGGYSGANAPSPHNITITDSLFAGSSGEVNVSGRDNSLVRKTCFKISGASSEIVSGMKIGSGVGFGKQCKSTGLKAPEKVGSSGNLSAANVSYNGSASTGASASSDSGGGSGWAGKLLGGLAVAPLIGIAVIAIPFIFGLLVLGGVTFGGLLLFFKKLCSVDRQTAKGWGS